MVRQALFFRIVRCPGRAARGGGRRLQLRRRKVHRIRGGSVPASHRGLLHLKALEQGKGVRIIRLMRLIKLLRLARISRTASHFKRLEIMCWSSPKALKGTADKTLTYADIQSSIHARPVCFLLITLWC